MKIIPFLKYIFRKSSINIKEIEHLSAFEYKHALHHAKETKLGKRNKRANKGII